MLQFQHCPHDNGQARRNEAMQATALIAEGDPETAAGLESMSALRGLGPLFFRCQLYVVLGSFSFDRLDAGLPRVALSALRGLGIQSFRPS